MNHPTDEVFNHIIDGRADQSEIKAINEHLTACGECTESFAGLQEVHQMLHGLRITNAPENFSDKVMSALRNEMTESSPMPLFVKCVFGFFALMIILTIGYVIGTDITVNSGKLIPALNNVSGLIQSGFTGLIDPKYYSSISFALIAALSMSVYFLFEKIRTLRYIK